MAEYATLKSSRMRHEIAYSWMFRPQDAGSPSRIASLLLAGRIRQFTNGWWNMFKVTAAALDRLSRQLAGKNANDDEAMRFTPGWRLCLDRLRPDDIAFTHEGRNVLLLDAAMAKAVAALTLDVGCAESDARLELRRIAHGREACDEVPRANRV
jgi:hypothetical protein